MKEMSHPIIKNANYILSILANTSALDLLYGFGNKSEENGKNKYILFTIKNLSQIILFPSIIDKGHVSPRKKWEKKT